MFGDAKNRYAYQYFFYRRRDLFGHEKLVQFRHSIVSYLLLAKLE